MKKYNKRELTLTIKDFKKLRPYKGKFLKYIEICNILKVPTYEGAECGGQQQSNHIAKMERFAKLKKVKNGYIIEKVYYKEKQIIRKRKRKCKFGDSTKILEYNLAESNNSRAVMSKNKLLELSGFVNHNYIVGKNNMEKVMEIAEVERKAVLCLFNYFGNMRKLNATHTVANSKAIREYSKELIVVKNGIHTVASQKEVARIKEAEEIGLAKVRCRTIEGAFVKGRYNAFMKHTLAHLKGIEYYYNGYKTRINRKAVKATENTAKNARANVQSLVEASMLKSLKKAKADASFIAQMQKLIDLFIKDTPIQIADLLV